MAGRLDQAIGTVDGVNQDFSTPAAFAPGSLVVFLNGQQLKRDLDNGWDEIDPSAGTFRMKIPPDGPRPGSTDDPGDVLFCYYDTGAAVSVGGAQLGGIPGMIAATELRPWMRTGDNLAPSMAGAEDAVAAVGSPGLGAEEVRPEMRTADELRPKMAGSKEV